MGRVVVMVLVASFAVGSLIAAGEPKEVDVLVVGGTVRGVETAVAEKRSGAKDVFLITPATYLGEDMAGTLELDWNGKGEASSDLIRRMWLGEDDTVPYHYRQRPGFRFQGGWEYHNDPTGKFFNSAQVENPWDSVLYTGRAEITCTLNSLELIHTVDVTVIEAADPNCDAASAVDARGAVVAGQGRGPFTGKISMTVLEGDAKGKVVELNRVSETPLSGSSFRPGEPDVVGLPTGCRSFKRVLYSARIDGKVSVARIDSDLADNAVCQLFSRIHFRLGGGRKTRTRPTPLKIKRTLDAVMDENGIGYLTGTMVRRVLRDSRGIANGVEMMNRSGMSILRAKKVIDATRYGALDAIDRGGTFAVGPMEEFSRVVIVAGEPPSAPDMKVERLPDEFPVYGAGITGIAYRCTMRLPMADGSYASFAKAEWLAREMTMAKGVLDDADLLVWNRSANCDGNVHYGKKPGGYDVVVVGGGTSGAPAAIAASRAGARTLLVEFINVLGGISTDGMILGYYDGNRCGFVDEFEAAKRTSGFRFGMYSRSETWRKFCTDAGVEVWLGAMGVGAVVKDGKVVAAEIATPMGVYEVGGKAFIDGTGNSDLAAAAGSDTEFISANEFALQSAGQAPQRLGAGTINSDFGYLNDSDAAAVHLFGARARAGAPSGVWDLAKMPDSRERRRIVADYRLSCPDIAAGRTFHDTVTQALSRQDSHGYLVDDFSFISEPSSVAQPNGKGRHRYWANIPLRTLLPRGLSGIAVVGTGLGVARDVLPIVRMQADLMNLGYAAGVAASMVALDCGGEFRRVDVGALKTRLVRKGILRAETLAWQEDGDVTSDAVIAEAVKTVPNGFKGSHVLWRVENRLRVLPLLKAEYAKASDMKAKQCYALILGLMGDDAGAETLAAMVDGRQKVLVRRLPGAIGSGRSFKSGLLIALGRTRSPLAVAPLVARLGNMRPESTVVEVRGAALALAELASPAAARPIAETMRKNGYIGFSRRSISELKPLGGYNLGFDDDLSIRELALARALYACGDYEGLARNILEAYSADPRSHFAVHAKAVLNQQGR